MRIAKNVHVILRDGKGKKLLGNGRTVAQNLTCRTFLEDEEAIYVQLQGLHTNTLNAEKKKLHVIIVCNRKSH